MKKAIYKNYRPPEATDVVSAEIPTPKPNEISVKIEVSSATRADTMMRRGAPKFGRLFLGLLKPKNISHSESAPVCDSFLTSYNFLKDIGNAKQGEQILNQGASGSLDSEVVQIAKKMGANITAVFITKNIDYVKSLGAENVIDYTNTPLDKIIDSYDIIYDTVGKLNYNDARKQLRTKGVFMTPVLICKILCLTIWSSKKVKFAATGIKKPDDLKSLLNDLVNFFAQGKLHTNIDKTYKLSEIVKVYIYIETGRQVGNIVVINS